VLDSADIKNRIWDPHGVSGSCYLYFAVSRPYFTFIACLFYHILLCYFVVFIAVSVFVQTFPSL